MFSARSHGPRPGAILEPMAGRSLPPGPKGAVIPATIWASARQGVQPVPIGHSPDGHAARPAASLRPYRHWYHRGERALGSLNRGRRAAASALLLATAIGAAGTTGMPAAFAADPGTLPQTVTLKTS